MISAIVLPLQASVHHAFTISRRTVTPAVANALSEYRTFVPSLGVSSCGAAGLNKTESLPSSSLIKEDVRIVLMVRFRMSSSMHTDEYVPGLFTEGISTVSIGPSMLSFSYPAWSGRGLGD